MLKSKFITNQIKSSKLNQPVNQQSLITNNIYVLANLSHKPWKNSITPTNDWQNCCLQIISFYFAKNSSPNSPVNLLANAKSSKQCKIVWLNEYATTTKFPLQISNQSKIETIISHKSTKNQAATMQPRIKQGLISHHKTTQPHAKNHLAATTYNKDKQPACNQELSSHCATHNQAATKSKRLRYQESTSHHTTKNQAGTAHTYKNQAATTRLRINPKSTSHHTTKNHQKNQAATMRTSYQESTSHQETKNQTATMWPRIKQPPRNHATNKAATMQLQPRIQESSIHHQTTQTMWPTIKQPPHDQQSSRYHTTKNLAAAMQQKIKLQPHNQESKNQAHTYTMGPRIKQPPQQATIRPKIKQPPPSPPSPHNQESTIHHATKNQLSYYTTKNQAATTHTTKNQAANMRPRINPETTSHHTRTKNHQEIKQPPWEQVTKNQPATMWPRIKQQP